MNKLAPTAKLVTPELAYIVGVLMGDGSIGGATEFQLAIKATDREFAIRTKESLEVQFGLYVGLHDYTYSGTNYYHGSYSITKVSLCSIAVVEFLRSIESEEWVRALAGPLLCYWLAGVWDSEGSISKMAKDSWLVQFSTKDRWLMKLYSWALATGLGIYAKVNGPYPNHGGQMFACAFTRPCDVLRFYMEVNPTIDRKRKIFQTAIYKSIETPRRLRWKGGRRRPKRD